MTRLISPSREELATIRPELEPGEKLVLNVFDRALPKGWEIYVQPHLNGLRPDFVLLHPQNGIAVLEVKDWNFDAMRYEVVQGEAGPELWATRDGRRFSRQKDNPFEKIRLYKKELEELYCASLPEEAWMAITTCVVFSAAPGARVRALFEEHYPDLIRYPKRNLLLGSDDLSRGQLSRLLPDAKYRVEGMTEQVAEDLRWWLIEPEFSAEQRAPLEFDPGQRRLVSNRPPRGRRRIKGAAGSGKSAVLAARAAELAIAGKKVLVVGFNITLSNYLRDVSTRWRPGESRQKNLTWLHFHGWCARTAALAGKGREWGRLFKSPDRTEDAKQRDTRLKNVFETVVPRFIVEILDAKTAASFEDPKLADALTFDAILADEGQDFGLPWWNALRAALRPRGELLLVADSSQDLYGRARSWTEEAMATAGFEKTAWTEMQVSYRLPESMIPLVRRFAADFLPNDQFVLPPEAPQQLLALHPVQLRWIQCPDGLLDDVAEREALVQPARLVSDRLSWSDVVVLTDTEEGGARIVRRLRGRGFKPVHTFPQVDYPDRKSDSNRIGRRLKVAFRKGAGSIKATTIHSFKGWESRSLVLVLTSLSSAAANAAAYAAMTRVRRHRRGSMLTVICSAPEGRPFGETWPEFIDAARPQDAFDDDDPWDLFDDKWRPLVSALHAREGVTVEAGGDVVAQGRVVGIAFASVEFEGRVLHLVDRSYPEGVQALAALRNGGDDAVGVHPEDPDTLTLVLSQLLGPPEGQP